MITIINVIARSTLKRRVYGFRDQSMQAGESLEETVYQNQSVL